MIGIKGIKLYQIIAARLRRLHPQRQAPFTYVAIGDSTVEGVGASDSQHTYASLIHAGVSLQFKHAAHQNLGKTGARVKDVVADQMDQAIAAKPDLITLSVGANDILRNTRLSTFRKEFSLLIEKLRSETQALIVVTNIPNFSLTPVVPRHLKPLAEFRIRRINACIQAVAEQYDLVLIDAFHHGTIFMRQFPHEVIYEDGFHPSDLGYALWANTILNTIQDKLPKKLTADS